VEFWKSMKSVGRKHTMVELRPERFWSRKFAIKEQTNWKRNHRHHHQQENKTPTAIKQSSRHNFCLNENSLLTCGRQTCHHCRCSESRLWQTWWSYPGRRWFRWQCSRRWCKPAFHGIRLAAPTAHWTPSQNTSVQFISRNLSFQPGFRGT